MGAFMARQIPSLNFGDHGRREGEGRDGIKGKRGERGEGRGIRPCNVTVTDYCT